MIENIGLTALAAFQRALAVTAHNISNASTPGYSRQQVIFSNLTGDISPAGPLGGGVELAAVRRSFDNLAFSQLRQATSNLGQTLVRSELTSLIDGFLGADGFDLAGPIANMSASLQDLATDPTSVAARTNVLSVAGTMADRFNVLDQRLSDVRSDLGNRLSSYTREINSLTGQIGELNRQINDQQLAGDGPNDLLDQRNRAIMELSQYMDIQVIQDGEFQNISLTNGTALVTGVEVNQLNVGPSEFDPRDLEVTLGTGISTEVLTVDTAGGQLGGVLSFLTDVLSPTQNEIGRAALGYSISLNEQHIRGLDLDGNQGLALFDVGQPQVFPSRNNSNLLTDTTGATIEDVTQITADDYELAFDGSNWSLTNLTTGSPVTLTADGADFLADGMRFTVDPGAAAGDRYQIRPSRNGAADLGLSLTNPRQLAAARALNTNADTLNQGNGLITEATVVDPANPQLLDDVDIVFTSASTYSINGGPDVTYTPGDEINLNGWRLTLSGNPASGDSFTVRSNVGGIGDGANAGAMATAERLDVLGNQTLSVIDAYQQLVTTVGVQAGALMAATEVQTNLAAAAQARQDNVSGVNLDEEAVNLQRYQQAYAAAAEVFGVANTMFDTLLRSVGR